VTTSSTLGTLLEGPSLQQQSSTRFKGAFHSPEKQFRLAQQAGPSSDCDQTNSVQIAEGREGLGRCCLSVPCTVHAAYPGGAGYWVKEQRAEEELWSQASEN